MCKDIVSYSCLSVVNMRDRHVKATRPLEDAYAETSEEHAKLLESCSRADLVTCISPDMSTAALNYTKLHTQKAVTWKDKEIDLDIHLSTSSKLTKALAIDFPFTSHDTAKKCLERLALAQHLSIDPKIDESNTFASAVATAMSPELQALEALKNESLLHCQIVQQVQELSERHGREYDKIKEEQHQRLVEFAGACRKEKEDVVWDALYQKAEVLAGLKSACIGKYKDVSSEDILKRLLQNAGGACKEVEVKLSQAEVKLSQSEVKLSQVQLNTECIVCFSHFSLKRKRACLDPCGHANTCINCATVAWKRSQKCSFCKASIDYFFDRRG